MAREVATTRVERVLDRIALDGLRLGEVHVGVGKAKEGSSHDGHAADGRHSAGVEHVRGGCGSGSGSGSDWMRAEQRVFECLWIARAC